MDYKFLWKAGQPDFRDIQFDISGWKGWLYKLLIRTGWINKIDLRDQMPPVVDQGSIGSCTANAICSVVRFERKRQNLPNDVDLSRLFLYYNERELLAPWAVNVDSGAIIRDGIKCVVQEGSIPETEWPYDVSQFTVKPSDQCYADALKDLVIKYCAVPQNKVNLRVALFQGFPIIFGFTVYESFLSPAVASTGIVPMPQDSESVLGGHCVSIVGFDNKNNWFICRNSWGDGWGDKGYFYMPYDYITNPNLCSDFWIIQKNSG